jgi:metal-responsive CopG/Arc/MetJ family transcriptional regulator
MQRVNMRISMELRLVRRVDRLVKTRVFTSRSHAIQVAVAEKFACSNRSRLRTECAKLDRKEEQALADEGLHRILDD